MFLNFKIRNIKYLFADVHPITKLLLLVFGMLSIFFITIFLGMLIAQPIFDLSLTEINELVKNNFQDADTGFIKYFQAIQSIGFFVLPGSIFWFLFRDKSYTGLPLTGKNLTFLGIIVVLTIIAMVPLISYLVVWNSSIEFPPGMAELEKSLQGMEEEAARLTEKIISGTTFREYLLNLFIIAILPAIGEELIFRGLLQNILLDWTKNSLVAIFIASIVFSAFHFQFYGFIPRLLLGIYFGCLFLWSRCIWFAVFAHFLNNSLAVSLVFLDGKGIDFFPAYFGETSLSALNLLTATILTIIFIWITWKYGNKNTFAEE